MRLLDRPKVGFLVLLMAFGSLPLMPASVHAQELAKLSIDPVEAIVGQDLEIVIELTELSPDKGFTCGAQITLGDGTSMYLRLEDGKIPYRLRHKYDRPGTFPIVVEGKFQFRGFNTTLGCGGANLTAAINVKSDDFEAKEAAERAAKEAALRKAAEERQAAEAAASRAAADRVAADQAAQKARGNRAAAEKSAARSAAMKEAAEREAARSAAALKAAEKATTQSVAPGAGTQSQTPPAPPQKSTAPAKARSLSDL